MSPSPGGHPGRTIPEWLDPQNLHGRLYYLMLIAEDGHELPKNPFVISRSIEQHVGKIEGGFIDRRNNSYVLKIRNKDQGRQLAKLTKLTDGTPIFIGRHPKLNQRKLVVTCKEVDSMSNDELLSELSSQKIIDVRRITKKTATGIIGTSTLVLTINSTVIPEFLYFGLLRIRTRLYYSQPLLCRQCLLYGHPKNKCQRKRACKNCSKFHENEEEECTSPSFCHNCQGHHSPIDRRCPLWVAETAAIKISTEQNIPIASARKMVPHSDSTNSSSSSYANIVKTTNPSNDNNNQHKHQQQQFSNQQQQRQPEANQQPSGQPNQKRALTRVEHTAPIHSQSPASEVSEPEPKNGSELESPPRKRNPTLPQCLPPASSSHEAASDVRPTSFPPGRLRSSRSQSRIAPKK